METKTFKRVRVSQDCDVESPRQWDNVSTMVCWHRNYILGDEQPECSPDEYRYGLANDHDDTGFFGFLEEHYGDPQSCTMVDVRDALRHLIQNIRLGYYSQERFFRDDWPAYRNAQRIFRQHEDVPGYARSLLAEHYVELPLYLYDHSGITMSTGRFSCPWDSGQVGFIYVEWEKAVREYGLTDERFPSLADKVERVNEALRTEVAVYDQYLTGDVYGYESETGVVVTKTWPDGSTEREIDWDSEDSCWGFFGDDPMTNGMADQVDEALHAALCEAAYYQNAGEWVYLMPDGSLTKDEDDLLQELNEEVE